jgi:hypothetical protein
VRDLPNSKAKTMPAAGLGWLAIGIGLFVCYLVSMRPSSMRFYEHMENEVYEAAVFVIGAAIGFGLGLQSFRVHRQYWIGFAGMALNGWLVLTWLSQVASWAFR